MKEKKIKYFEEKARSPKEKISTGEIDWFISFLFLSSGVILQGIAALILLL
jgi:hypothetical protein